MMVIDPDECIDCAVCIPECPVNAIWAEEDLPSKQIGFLAINQKLAITGAAITRRKSPLPNAEAWKNVPGKAILAQSSLTDLRLSEIEGKMSKLKNLVTAEELLPNEWSSDTLSEKNFSRLKLISL
jgi:ferredoxin